jgi:hypothetical protein
VEAFLSENPCAPERTSGEELFTAFLCFARAVGATRMTILPGMVFDGEIWHDALERAAEVLRRRLDQAQVEGLRLSVEPHIVTTRPYLGSQPAAEPVPDSLVAELSLRVYDPALVSFDDAVEAAQAAVRAAEAAPL